MCEIAPAQRESLVAIKECCERAAQPVAAIFVHSPLHVKILVRLAEKMVGSSVLPIMISAPEVEVGEHDFASFSLSENEACHLEGPAIIISMDAATRFPTSIPVVSIPHAFVFDAGTDVTPNTYGYFGYLLLYSDFVFMPNPELNSFKPEDFVGSWGERFPASCSERMGREFSIIPGGYLKNDLLLEEMEKQGVERHSILVAPTKMNLVGRDYVSMCSNMLDAALEHSHGTSVIYRPYPDDMGTPEVTEVVKRYEDEAAFVWDTSSSSVASFAAARLLITDSSLTRITYTMATGLPHITYGVYPECDLNAHELGFHASTKEQLGQAVKRCLEDPTIKERVAAGRSGKILNPGEAYACLIDSIEAILAQKKRPYWISFERRFAEGDWSQPEAWSALLDKPHINKHCFNLLQSFARRRFPNNPLFSLDMRLGEINAMQMDYETSRMIPLTVDDIVRYTDEPSLLPAYMIWGTSQNYQDNYRDMMIGSGERCLGFLDSSPGLWGELLDGKPIHSPDSIWSLKPEIVFIASCAVIPITHALHKILVGENRTG